MGSLTTSYFGNAKNIIEGVKISVARFNSPGLIAKLHSVETSFAPSPTLLRDSKAGKIAWEEYIKIYTLEQREHFRKAPEDFFRLLERAALEDVILFCYEKFEGRETKCHRLLLFEMLKKIAKSENIPVNFIDEKL